MLSDRIANKSVLAVAAPGYILCIVAMIGASQIELRGWLIAYLVGLHLLMGLAVAGVTLATANINLRLSPKGSATAYVATGALASSLAAGSRRCWGVRSLSSSPAAGSNSSPAGLARTRP